MGKGRLSLPGALVAAGLLFWVCLYEKTGEKLSGFYYVARLAGIEPTTPWFVAKYSIQLSYSREDKYYNR